MVEEIRRIYLKSGFIDKFLLVIVIIGLLVVFISLFRGILMTRQVQIEYSSMETGENISKILVDIEGAVVKPGVYELQSNSRIKDVLVLAGGYSQTADRVYCEKNINLASLVKDGQKIYIPFVVDTPDRGGYSEARTGSELVNLNTASEKELDTLWGIGTARIENIVKNRPYQTLEELLEKKVFTKQILEKNKDKITIY